MSSAAAGITRKPSLPPRVMPWASILGPLWAQSGIQYKFYNKRLTFITKAATIPSQPNNKLTKSNFREPT